MPYAATKGSHGFCTKDKHGNRKHLMVTQADGFGRTFSSCLLCGMLPVKLPARKRLKYEDNPQESFA